MKIALASDHAGFEYKQAIHGWLTGHGYDVKDFGTFSNERVDYPDFIQPAAEAVARGECERGIVLGGSGNGEAIAANKVRGVRCALCWSEDTARTYLYWAAHPWLSLSAEWFYERLGRGSGERNHGRIV